MQSHSRTIVGQWPKKTLVTKNPASWLHRGVVCKVLKFYLKVKLKTFLRTLVCTSILSTREELNKSLIVHGPTLGSPSPHYSLTVNLSVYLFDCLLLLKHFSNSSKTLASFFLLFYIFHLIHLLLCNSLFIHCSPVLLFKCLLLTVFCLLVVDFSSCRFLI